LFDLKGYGEAGLYTWYQSWLSMIGGFHHPMSGEGLCSYSYMSCSGVGAVERLAVKSVLRVSSVATLLG